MGLEGSRDGFLCLFVCLFVGFGFDLIGLDCELEWERRLWCLFLFGEWIGDC